MRTPLLPSVEDEPVDEDTWVDDGYPPVADDADSADETDATAWIEEFADGAKGSTVFAVSVVAVVGCVGVNWMLTGGLSFFFDLSFVVLCLAAAMLVDTRDAFSLCVLPPLAFGVAVAGLSLVDPGALIADGAVGQAFLVGLAAHAGALVAGYGLALAALAARWVGGRTPAGPAVDGR